MMRSQSVHRPQPVRRNLTVRLGVGGNWSIRKGCSYGEASKPITVVITVVITIFVEEEPSNHQP